MRFADLATRAALGTTSRPLSASELPDAVAASLPDGVAGADLLLGAAAAFAVVRAAQVASGPAEPLDLPHPSRPEAPSAFAALLRRMRAEGGTCGDLQREALALLAERDLTLPADLLIELLRELDRPGAPVRLIGRVLDDRGWALVGYDSRWAARLEGSGAAASVDERLWHEGTLGQRVEYLDAVRRADPAAGLALLESLDWRKETAEARERFVQALSGGLSGADEAFLEATLDDRAGSVRQAAARLLSELPSSRLVARAEALASAQLTRQKRLLRAPVTLARGVPETTETRRDGYPSGKADTPAHQRERLAHAISLVPTMRWPALLGATASELASGPVECDGSPLELRPAWVIAAARWRDAALARALLASDLEGLPTLASVLPDAERDDLVVRQLRANPGQLGALTGVLPARFGARLSEALAGVAEAWLGRPGPAQYLVPELVRLIAVRAEPSAASGLAARLQVDAERLPTDRAPARRALLGAASTLQLRGALADALAPFPVRSPITDEETRP